MKRIRIQYPILLLLLLFLSSVFFPNINIYAQIKQTKKMSQLDALITGTNVYIYGYPLVTMEFTRKVMTNVPRPQGSRAPMGQFINLRSYPTSAFHDVVAPNADTLYSIAWLNLGKQPYILHVPDVKGRYYLMTLLSGWTNVFASIGTRTTGTKAQDFAIVGPYFKGTLPEGVTTLKSPTNIVWVIGRTYSKGTPEDFKIVHAIQDAYKLTPLSDYGKASYSPKSVNIDFTIDMRTPVRKQVESLSAASFFHYLASLMVNNPPSPDDEPMLATMAKVGIYPGKPFDINKLDPAIVKGLNASVKAGQEKIMLHMKEAGTVVNGWTYFEKTGYYGTDYLQRALIAMVDLGASLPEDAIYPINTLDSSGYPLNGNDSYMLRFRDSQLPPVNGFWSLTLYNDQYFFTQNALNRYNVSSRSHLQQNDGFVTIYIQHDSPGQDKESNWLPAPKGKFVLMFRFYWPKEAIINKTWQPPGLKEIYKL